MADSTLFPAETGVKWTARTPAPIIADMRRGVSRAALVTLGALACNNGLQPVPVCPPGFLGICGTVAFRGAVPDSTQAVFIVAFDSFPQTLSDLFKFKPASPVPLPRDRPTFKYAVPLPNGRYQWVLAVWEKVGTLTPLTAGTAATSDVAGRFRLPGIPPGRVVLRFARLGYRVTQDTVVVPAGDSVRVDVTLRPSRFALEPVIVTAAKRSQLLDQSATSVALVSDSDLARRALSTVDEAVDKAPGVLFLNGQVNIRGSSGFVEGLGSRVLLLVDGVPANQGDRGGIDWDMVPLAEVAHVEVLKGAGSSLYGSAALGGVVNVITRETPLGFHARIRATGGAYANPPFDVWRFRGGVGALGGLDATASYGQGAVRGSLTLGGRHSDGYREQDRSDQWEMSGKAEWLPQPGTRVPTSGAWTSHQYEVFPTWCVPVPPGTRACDTRGQAFQPFLIDSSGAGSYTRSNKGYLSATLDRTVSSRFSWEARGSWLRTHFTDVNPDDWAVSNRFGGEVRGVSRSPSGRVVTAGVEVARGDVTSDIFGDHTQNQVGVYGEAEGLLGGARVTAGTRIEHPGAH